MVYSSYFFAIWGAYCRFERVSPMLRLFSLVIAPFLIAMATGVSASSDLDVVYLKNGSRIVGTIVELVPSEKVKIRTSDGSEFVYTMGEVERITREPAPTTSDRRDIQAVAYPELGVVLGTPGAINGVAGYWFGQYGVRVSGGYVERNSDNFWGMQLNMMKKIRDTPVSRHAVGIMGMAHRTKYMDNWILRRKSIYGGGIAYNYNWRGLFVETGLLAGANTGYSAVQLLFQIGYMYRFLPEQPPSSR